VVLRLGRRAFAWWDTPRKRWRVESGWFTLHVGASIADIRLKARVHVTESAPQQRVADRNTTFGDILAHPAFADVADTMAQRLRRAMGLTDPGAPEHAMMNALALELPLRNLSWLAGSAFDRETVAAIIDVANGKRPASALRPLFAPRP
jgi:beta-glucosidase